jgi:hypothetical protein
VIYFAIRLVLVKRISNCVAIAVVVQSLRHLVSEFTLVIGVSFICLPLSPLLLD